MKSIILILISLALVIVAGARDPLINGELALTPDSQRPAGGSFVTVTDGDPNGTTKQELRVIPITKATADALFNGIVGGGPPPDEVIITDQVLAGSVPFPVDQTQEVIAYNPVARKIFLWDPTPDDVWYEFAGGGGQVIDAGAQTDPALIANPPILTNAYIAYNDFGSLFAWDISTVSWDAILVAATLIREYIGPVGRETDVSATFIGTPGDVTCLIAAGTVTITVADFTDLISVNMNGGAGDEIVVLGDNQITFNVVSNVLGEAPLNSFIAPTVSMFDKGVDSDPSLATAWTQVDLGARTKLYNMTATGHLLTISNIQNSTSWIISLRY